MKSILDLATELLRSGERAVADEAAAEEEQARLRCSTPAKSGYPFKSEALCYHPKQRAEAAKKLESLGVPTEIAKSGHPVIRDAAHYKQLRRALKVHHRNAYYD